MDRRDFLLSTAAAAAMFGATQAVSRNISHRGRISSVFGIQLWSVANMLSADFDKTIAWLASLGYRELETYGPYTFSDPTNVAHWKTLTPRLGFSGSGFFGHSLEQVKASLARYGMRVPSMHTDLATLQNRMGVLAETAHAIGATYVTLPSIPQGLRQTLEDYKHAADILNKVGLDATSHGVRFAYHNHGYGLKPIDGQVPLDLLLDRTDPANVFLELDTYWAIAGGADPLSYLERYKGRYKMMHLKDMKGTHRFTGDGGGPSQWIEMFPFITYLGDGSLDIKAIIDEAKRSGVEHFFVEQDSADDLMAAVKGSAAYLKKLGFR